MSVLPDVTPDPPDVIFDLQARIETDKRQEKINLSIGAYQTPEKGTVLLDVVKEAERLLIEEENTKEYLPIEGEENLLSLIGQLVLGQEGGFAGVQTIGGTGALSIGGDFIRHNLRPVIAIPDPSWANHCGVFTTTQLEIIRYPYANQERTAIEFAALCNAIESLSEKSTVLFHACCHNPTGLDLSIEQWETLSSLCQKKKLLPFFDLAYQGYGKGLDDDAEAIRLFSKKGIEFFLSVSFSKNATLYSERVGALLVVSQNQQRREAIVSKLKTRIRTTYSNPPSHGAKVVQKLLGEPGLRALWIQELETTRRRITELRSLFASALESEIKGRDFTYLRNGSGLFAFVDLQEGQLKRLVDEFAIYVTKGGRINIAGLSRDTISLVAHAIAQVVS